MSAHATARAAHNRTTPILLGVIAALLGLNLVTTVVVGPGALESRAVAQQSEENPTGFVAAAEQRKQMIAELKVLAARMERIEAAMKAGINVKVLSMPEQASE